LAAIIVAAVAACGVRATMKYRRFVAADRAKFGVR